MIGQTVTETNFIQDSPEGKIAASGNIFLRAGTVNNNNSTVVASGILDASGVINNISQGRVRASTRHLADTAIYRSSFYGRLYYYDESDTEENRKYVDAILRFHDETIYEQLPSSTALFGGGQAVIIHAPSVNNITKNPTNVTGGNFSTLQSTQQSNVPKIQTVLGNTTLQGNSTLAQNGGTTINPGNTPVNNQTSIGQSGQSSSVTGVGSGNNNILQQMGLDSTVNQIGNGGNFSNLQSTQQSKVSEIQSASGNTTLQGNTTLGQPGGTTVTLSGTSGNQVSVGQSGQSSTVSGVMNSNSMNITLPSNGLYTIHTEPKSHYLVVTDPRFANYQNFVSSDYMLQHLGLDPSKTMKLIGDAFYQQKLIRNQISELTGQQFLNGYSSNDEEYKALMDSGVSYAKQFNLQVGVALTAEQMAQLTSDMVWMVEQEVQGQKVLVPVVYLSHLQDGDLQPSGAVIKAKNIQITAEEDIVNQNGTITGGQIGLVAGRDIKNETVTYEAKTGNKLYGNDSRTIAGQTATISAQGSLSVAAGRDISIIGGQVSSGQNIALNAGRNLEVGAVATDHKATAGDYHLETTNNITSSIKADGNLAMIAKEDINLSGAQVDAGKDLTLKSIAGNINLTAVKDEEILDDKVGTRKNWKKTHTDDETVIGSTLQGGSNVIIAAVNASNNTANTNGGNITIAGSNIYSDSGAIIITADKDVKIQEIKEKHESLVQTHKKKSGFLSSKTTDKLDYSLVNEVKGSTISGDSVDISSGKDLTVKGSNVVATNDVTLHADNNVNITSAQETGQDEHYKRVKKSGLFSGGGLGFTIGKQTETTTLNEKVKGEIGSTIGSIAGNVSVTAGNKVNSAGSTFASGKDINITGRDVTIDNTINTYDSQYKYEFKQSGLSVSLGGGVIDAGTSLVGNVGRAGEVEDERLKALYGFKAQQDLKKLGDQLEGNFKDGLSINVSLGSSKMTVEQNTHVETVNTSNITAGGDVTIKATEGNVSLKATSVNATDVTLDAAKDINIESAQNKEQSNSKTNSSSSSIGASFGLAGSFGGFTGSANSSKGKENVTISTNTESVINASGTATLKSGNDTNIIGSQVKGEKVVADIGGNLNIVSQQDSDIFTSKNQSAGFGFGTDKISGTHGSANRGKTNSEYSSVIDQAGIYAGKDGFDITVEKNTDLQGAVISSEAPAVKNALKTGTITFSNLENRAKYQANSVGVGYAAGKDANGKAVTDKDKGLTPNIGVSASGDASSTTQSAISPGTIEVRSNPNQDLSGINRDPSGAVNALGKIFDKKTVQEKQELAKVFGEEAFKAIGDLAASFQKEAKSKYSESTEKLSAAQDALKAGNIELAKQLYQEGTNLKMEADALTSKWSEGGSAKVALNIVAGGLMASLGGSSFASGATGAALNEAIQGELSKLNDPAVRQWASAIIGATASKVVGGDAQTGASTAVSGTRNNSLDPDHELSQRQLQDEKEENQQQYDQLTGDLNNSVANGNQNLVDSGKSSPDLLKELGNRINAFKNQQQQEQFVRDVQTASETLKMMGKSQDDPNYYALLQQEVESLQDAREAVEGFTSGIKTVTGKIFTEIAALKVASKADTIRKVGNDILDQMEAAGGHTLERHVAQTNEELIKRAIQEDVEAATSFTDKSTATKAIQENLRKNADDIAKWLNESDTGRAIFDVSNSFPVGKGVLQDSKHVIYDLGISRVVLVRDASQELGFRVLTGFPVIK
ncbi:Haemagluttinin repeat-containing protein [Sporomusa malonica]|uniref:Haemagluttinin repeat-containing protein n=1 Tax=Sporomusa malonica TaxID=112901 RepID=A0A1W2E4E6_9FIRM|nr:Haemagluttinin repeat-containing protein [Sporomusa malonica]